MKKKGFTPTPFAALCQKLFLNTVCAQSMRRSHAHNFSARCGMIKTMPRKVLGFTVLELLISVAIIAMLAAITMAVVSTTREKSRDAKRVSALHQLQNALNIYYAQAGRFPIANPAVALSGTDPVSIELVNQDAIKAAAVDPIHPAYSYQYQSADGTTFTISFCLETNTIKGYTQGCGNTIVP